MLSRAEAVAYLLEAGLLTRADVVDGGLVVDDASRRNRNYAVRTRDGRGYFLKQGDLRPYPETLEREARAYRFVRGRAGAFASDHMPRLVRYDRSEGLLVLAHVDSHGGRTAPEDDVEGGRERAWGLGRALARLHDVPPPDPGEFAAPGPWILSLPRPGREILDEFSVVAVHVVRIVQQSAVLAAHFADLSRDAGRRALIHGDVRWDNCLMRADGGAEPPRKAVLVDWELSGAGDPCRDVGGVISEFLSSWVRSLPSAPSIPAEVSVAAATTPVAGLRGALGDFWEAYRGGGRSADEGWPFLRRAVRCSSARLVQSALESAQSASTLTCAIVYMLQLAENIVADPRRAARGLLGLPVP